MGGLYIIPFSFRPSADLGPFLSGGSESPKVSQQILKKTETLNLGGWARALGRVPSRCPESSRLNFDEITTSIPSVGRRDALHGRNAGKC